jgi:hypothetical protein
MPFLLLHFLMVLTLSIFVKFWSYALCLCIFSVVYENMVVVYENMVGEKLFCRMFRLRLCLYDQ